MEPELVFAGDPNENPGLAVSVGPSTVSVTGPELGKGPKPKGRGDGVDCGGGTPVNGDVSPNNDGLVLCGAELVVDVLGSNKGFGAMEAVSGFLSVAATRNNGWLEVDFSGTARGFPKANGRLGLLLGTAVVVDAGLSSEVLPNENSEGAGFCSSAVFWKENDPMIGLLSID